MKALCASEITIDGLDATEKMAAMIKNSPFYGEIRVVVLDGRHIRWFQCGGHQ